MLFTGPIQMYGRTGRAVQVSSSDEVVLSADVQGATTFQLVECRARDTVSEALRPRCVSMMDANRTDWYVRHRDYYLRVDPEYNTDDRPLFELDSSFIMHSDTFYADHYALESLNHRNLYIMTHDDGRLAIVQRNNIADYYDAASFRVYDYNTSSTFFGFVYDTVQICRQFWVTLYPGCFSC